MPGEENILLTKSDHTDVNELPPGQYVPYMRNRGYGSTAWLGWRCPGCHRTLLLLRSVHTVDFEGVVTPRVGCPEQGCGLVGHVQLADWVPEARGNA